MRELGSVGLVHGNHHVAERIGETAVAAITLVDHAGRGGRAGVDDVVLRAFAGVAHRFRCMVVEHQMGTCHVRQVGGDVAVGDGDLAVLHVLGVDKLDLVDHLHFA